MSCPTVIRVTTAQGPPGVGLPAGTADAGKFVRKAGSTAYAYELVTPDAIGLPQALAATDSPTFAGLTLSGLAANGLLFTGTGGLLTRLPLGPGLSITGGQLTATGPGSTDGVPEGSVNLYFTSTRGQTAAASWWSTHSSTVGKQLATAADATAGRTAIGAEQAGAAAGVQTALTARLDQFRDASTFHVSKRIGASDSNNGTSPGEPFLTIGAAVAAANAYVTANPGAKAKIKVGPGRFVETALPFRSKPNILARGASQRSTVIVPAAGQELNGFWALDSGCMLMDFTFAGHQAQNTSPTDSTVGQRAWAITFNEQANGGQGVILTASPYIKDCLSLTAEDDTGEAGSTSTGDCGGGVEVDGAKCHPNSPIRSMVVYGFTQQNLGGPGAVVKNDAYAELVSFFGLFGTWHVRCETGGQATMSGGGCSEFGIYGLVADGYSPTSLFTGSLRVAATAGDTTVDVVSLSANRLGSSSRPAAGQVLLLGGQGYVVQSSLPITAGGVVVPDSDPTRAGYRVTFFNPTGLGLVANAAQGAAVSFRQRSQISAGCHSANYVGSGTNYSALPWNGGVPVRANEIVETNFGRVFGLIVNDIGDVRIANGAFEIDGTTGEVTINTSSFNLSGLNAIGPFSRNGGISTVGVQLQEVSNNASLLASTGASDGNTAPTQSAVRNYVDNRFLVGLTRTSGQPLTITDTSTQDGSGFWTRTRNIELSMNTADGLVRLDGTGRLPAVDGSQLTGLPATDLDYVPATRTVTSSTGTDAVLTLADDVNAGLMSSADYLKLLSLTFGVLPVPVRNNTGAEIAKGTPVYVTGSSGTRITIAPADASLEATAARTLGLTSAAIANNSDGTVIAAGPLEGLNTASLTEGATTWLSETTGQVTTTRPVAPAHGVSLGFVIKSGPGTSGILYVKVDNGLELEELHDVLITGKATGQALMLAADGLWKNRLLVAADLSDSSASGRAVLTGTPAQGRTALELNTAAQSAATDFVSATTTRSANVVLAGPATGAAATPTFRALVAADLPATAVTAGAYGSASSVGTFTVDAQGRLTAAGNVSISIAAGAVSGLAAVATSGAYLDLSGRPTLGTSAALDVAPTGNAATGQVVKGDDSRLSDARTPAAHNQAWSTITDTPTTLAGYGITDALTSAAAATTYQPLTFTNGTITYAATVDLDMAARNGTYQTISLTGNLTLTTSNRAAGRTVTLRLICDATQRNLTVPAGWVFVGTKPSNIAASKTGVLSLTFFGTADGDCVAAYGVQS